MPEFEKTIDMIDEEKIHSEKSIPENETSNVIIEVITYAEKRKPDARTFNLQDYKKNKLIKQIIEKGKSY